MPYKIFQVGEEALAADVNNYLAEQAVARFTTATQRSTQLATPELNQLSMLDSAPGIIQYWNGTTWVTLGPRTTYAAANPNTVVASPADFTLVSFAMPFTGNVSLIGYATAIAGAGATSLEISMTCDASGASTPTPSLATNGYGGAQPANTYFGSMPVSAFWSGLAAGTVLTVKYRLSSTAPGSMGAQVNAMAGVLNIAPAAYFV